jgi:hypothetical protein
VIRFTLQTSRRETDDAWFALLGAGSLRRPLLKLLPRAALLVLLLLVCQPVKPNIFGDIANGLKKKKETIENGIGNAVGVKLSGVLETATTPVLDNAASRFSDVAKGAADRLDQSLQGENQSIDAIAKENIGRLDALAGTRLDQVDKFIDDRLQKVARDANGILNREASIIDNALTQENSIVNNALNRVQTISQQSLDRVQGIESDAFNRIDSALQDEVPLAASEVAHEFVVAALVVACIVALFGFAGISLWKNLRNAGSGNATMTQTLKAGFVNFWRTLPQQAAVVVIPTVLIAAAILGGYEIYLRSMQATRVARLEKGASLLEAAGDYTLAGELRRRVLAVDSERDSKHQEFNYQADVWLADLTQKRSVAWSDLVRRLSVLESNDWSDSNGDLSAAAIYLKADSAGQLDSGAATHYVQRFVEGKTASQVPFMGKLVLMARIKGILNGGAGASARVNQALKATQELRTLYPKYANGHILAAALMGMQADALASGANPDSNQEATLRKGVSGELSHAASLDPDLLRIVRLTSLNLPADLLKDLDEKPHSPDLAARLGEFAASDIDPLARGILTSDVLTHLAVNRTILHATRRGIGEHRAARAIAALPASAAKPEQQAAAMVAIAEQFFDIDSYLPAESWAQSARKALANIPQPDPALNKRIDSLAKSLEQAKISDKLAAVI